MNKTIIYLHGFGSSGQSGTVKYLRKIFPQFNVLAPDIPVKPSKAIPFLKQYCEDNHPDLIIGTSMGAMYAMQMHRYMRICVNPALRMSELTDILKSGTFKYFQPTQSGETHFTITEDTIQQFREMEAHLFDGVNNNNKLFCWGFFGDEDTTVNCREEFERYFGPNIKTFHGGHRMNNRIIDDEILPFVESLFNCFSSKYQKGDFVFDSDIIEKMSNEQLRAENWVLINLPEGFSEVPSSMCEHWKELKHVVLPSTIKDIGICAFNGCTKLREINLPDSIEFIEDGAFRFCESLKQVHLPSNLKILSPELFYGSGIESIDIPSNITGIGYWAFWGCKHMKSLVIPESVTSLGYGIVSAHEGFEGVICNAKGYHVENDALIDDENQELLCCWTQQKHYVVPECVKRIADFSGNEFVETITSKQPIELTTKQVFASDINLRKVDFQKCITGITEQIFWNCPKIEK